MTRSIIVMLLLCITVQTNQADVVDVFFLAGQSNASGRVSTGYSQDPRDAGVRYYYRTDGPSAFNTTSNGWTTLQPLSTGYYGPEISLGRELVSLGFNPAIIKVTDGATSLGTDWNSQLSGTWWNNWVADTDDAISSMGNVDIRLSGFFWLQGENDALSESFSNDYEANFTSFVNEVGNVLGSLGQDDSNMPFVTALIQDNWIYSDQVRESQRNVMESRLDHYWFDTDDLTLKDSAHFDKESVAEIGRRFAASTNLKPVPEPSGFVLLCVCSLFVLSRRYYGGRGRS